MILIRPRPNSPSSFRSERTSRELLTSDVLTVNNELSPARNHRNGLYQQFLLCRKLYPFRTVVWISCRFSSRVCYRLVYITVQFELKAHGYETHPRILLPYLVSAVGWGWMFINALRRNTKIWLNKNASFLRFSSLAYINHTVTVHICI